MRTEHKVCVRHWSRWYFTIVCEAKETKLNSYLVPREDQLKLYIGYVDNNLSQCHIRPRQLDHISLTKVRECNIMCKGRDGIMPPKHQTENTIWLSARRWKTWKRFLRIRLFDEKPGHRNINYLMMKEVSCQIHVHWAAYRPDVTIRSEGGILLWIQLQQIFSVIDCGPSTLRQRDLKTDVTLWKCIKCFAFAVKNARLRKNSVREFIWLLWRHCFRKYPPRSQRLQIRFAERFLKASFSWRLSVHGRANSRIKGA